MRYTPANSVQNTSRPILPADPARTAGITTFPVTGLPSSKASPRLLHILPNALDSVFGEIVRKGYDTLIFTLDNAAEIEAAETLMRMRRGRSLRMILLSPQPRQVLMQWLKQLDPGLVKRYSDLVMQADGEIVISPVPGQGNSALLCQEYLREHCSLIIRP